MSRTLHLASLCAALLVPGAAVADSTFDPLSMDRHTPVTTFGGDGIVRKCQPSDVGPLGNFARGRRANSAKLTEFGSCLFRYVKADDRSLRM